MVSPSTASSVATKVGTSGKIFFGGLCVGTFGLGCWQLERLVEKWDAIEDRHQQLKLAPIRYGSNGSISDSTDTMPFRQRLLRGKFRHDKEVLIGPRGM